MSDQCKFNQKTVKSRELITVFLYTPTKLLLGKEAPLAVKRKRVGLMHFLESIVAAKFREGA